MNLLLPLLITSGVINILLALRVLLLRSDLDHYRKLLYGAIEEKSRLRKIVRKIKINLN
jgi:hypothetical protein